MCPRGDLHINHTAQVGWVSQYWQGRPQVTRAHNRIRRSAERAACDLLFTARQNTDGLRDILNIACSAPVGRSR